MEIIIALLLGTFVIFTGVISYCRICKDFKIEIEGENSAGRGEKK